MDPELRQLIKETLALTRENHRLLRAMRRNQLFWLIVKVGLWAILILAPLYFLRPYIGALPSATEAEKSLETLRELLGTENKVTP
jgi:Kef-type K+ transport system membrane component KefB